MSNYSPERAMDTLPFTSKKRKRKEKKEKFSISSPNSPDVAHKLSRRWSRTPRQSGDSARNGLYLTLIHRRARFTDLLTGTYFTLRVFRLTYFCPLTPPPPSISKLSVAIFSFLFCEDPKRIRHEAPD